MKPGYIEKIYAGWLGKVIGIRLGADVEGWTYEQIREKYGELDHYPVNYKRFAADDDSNGPLFYLRALEHSGLRLTPQAVGDALLNYAPFENGFFWWGGYGVSTEHTAYLNLYHGVPAPQSGSMALNGQTVAEQIGGQIFIDTWGLVSPGNPQQAAGFARMAASVTHDGNGIYGGIFIAVCIALAFEEASARTVVEKALGYIPADCEYARVARAVTAWHSKNPEDWRACFEYVRASFGYDKYPGACHIIPNAAVIILALLYGGDDFSRTLTICNMCGWDTDCNAGNVGAIMGVLCGLDAIDYGKWRAPVNDFLACSSVVGSLNLMDIPYGAGYIARLAYQLAGEKPPQPWEELFEKRIQSCHFEYPGSTHALEARPEPPLPNTATLVNTDEAAHTGSRSLRVRAGPLPAGGRVFVYQPTYLLPANFDDARYSPAFSPLLYPGQTLHGSTLLAPGGRGCTAALYVKNAAGAVAQSKARPLRKGEWAELEFRIPPMEGPLCEAGFVLEADRDGEARLDCFVDDLYWDGQPKYTLDCATLVAEEWSDSHRPVRQFTKRKGQVYVDGGALHISGADYAEAYTGAHTWRDYTASFALTPHAGGHHLALVRVQGGIYGYAAGFFGKGRLAVLKNTKGYQTLAECTFAWEHGQEYVLTVAVRGATLSLSVNGEPLLTVTDEVTPYLTGGIGLGVREGSHMSCRCIDLL